MVDVEGNAVAGTSPFPNAIWERGRLCLGTGLSRQLCCPLGMELDLLPDAEGGEDLAKDVVAFDFAHDFADGVQS